MSLVLEGHSITIRFRQVTHIEDAILVPLVDQPETKVFTPRVRPGAVRIRPIEIAEADTTEVFEPSVKAGIVGDVIKPDEVADAETTEVFSPKVEEGSPPQTIIPSFIDTETTVFAPDVGDAPPAPQIAFAFFYIDDFDVEADGSATKITVSAGSTVTFTCADTGGGFSDFAGTVEYFRVDSASDENGVFMEDSTDDANDYQADVAFPDAGTYLVRARAISAGQYNVEDYSDNAVEIEVT